MKLFFFLSTSTILLFGASIVNAASPLTEVGQLDRGICITTFSTNPKITLEDYTTFISSTVTLDLMQHPSNRPLDNEAIANVIFGDEETISDELLDLSGSYHCNVDVLRKTYTDNNGDYAAFIPSWITVLNEDVMEPFIRTACQDTFFNYDSESSHELGLFCHQYKKGEIDFREVDGLESAIVLESQYQSVEDNGSIEINEEEALNVSQRLCKMLHRQWSTNILPNFVQYYKDHQLLSVVDTPHYAESDAFLETKFVGTRIGDNGEKEISSASAMFSTDDLFRNEKRFLIMGGIGMVTGLAALLISVGTAIYVIKSNCRSRHIKE